MQQYIVLYARDGKSMPGFVKIVFRGGEATVTARLSGAGTGEATLVIEGGKRRERLSMQPRRAQWLGAGRLTLDEGRLVAAVYDGENLLALGENRNPKAAWEAYEVLGQPPGGGTKRVQADAAVKAAAGGAAEVAQAGDAAKVAAEAAQMDDAAEVAVEVAQEGDAVEVAAEAEQIDDAAEVVAEAAQMDDAAEVAAEVAQEDDAAEVAAEVAQEGDAVEVVAEAAQMDDAAEVAAEVAQEDDARAPSAQGEAAWHARPSRSSAVAGETNVNQRGRGRAPRAEPAAAEDARPRLWSHLEGQRVRDGARDEGGMRHTAAQDGDHRAAARENATQTPHSGVSTPPYAGDGRGSVPEGRCAQQGDDIRLAVQGPYADLWRWRRVEGRERSFHYLMGEAVVDGRIVAVAVAVPGAYAPSPPPNLQGFTAYRDGHWLLAQDAQTGRSIPI